MAEFEIRKKVSGKWVIPCVAGAVAAPRAVRAAQASAGKPHLSADLLKWLWRNLGSEKGQKGVRKVGKALRCRGKRRAAFGG